MALIFMDSLDLYNDLADLERFYTGSASAFETSGGRFGGGAIVLSAQSNDLTFNLPSVVTTGNHLWLALAFLQVNPFGTGDENFIVFRTDNDGDDAFQILANDAADNYLIEDITNTTLATFSVSKGVWNWLEIDVEYGSATAAIRVTLNGVDVYNGTGDTDDAGATGFASIEFGTTFSGDIKLDDIMVGDDSGTENTTAPGDTKIVVLTPDGAGGSTQFTPNGAATNHEAADDTPFDGDTTYNASGTSGHRDTFSMSNLPETPDSIVGVQARTVARKDDVGALVLRSVVVSGATTIAGDNFGLTEGYSTGIRDIFDTDPDTSSPWTESGVNSIESGYEIP